MSREDKVRSKLDLALASTDVAALIPEDLEPIIVDLVKALSPLIANVEVGRGDGKVHSFNKITGIGLAYFQGEKGTSQAVGPTYVRDNVTLKILSNGESITHFAQSVTRKQVNLFKDAIMRAVRAMTFGTEFGMIWGWGKELAATKDGDLYAYDGLDPKLLTNRVDHNGVVTTLLLDNLIDGVRTAGAEHDKWMFLMSPHMQSKVSGLQSRLRRESPKVDVKGGFRLNTYNDIPIAPSSYCKPSGTMGTVTAADDATAGGLVATKTYRWKVAPVTTYGEQAASAEVSHTTGGGITSVKLSFSAFSGARLYKIYRTVDGGGAGTEVFCATTSAFTYDGNGTVTGNVVDYVDITADAGLGVPFSDVPITINDEVVALVDLNKENGIQLISLVNEEGQALTNLIQYIELAKTKSSKDFLLESFQALAVKGEKYSAWARRVRLA